MREGFAALRGMVGWIQANLLACLIAAVAIAGMIGAGAFLLSIGGRSDNLHTTQSEIFELSRLTVGLRSQTVAAFDRGRPGPGDMTVHGQIETNALRTAHWIEREWHDPIVAGITKPTLAVATSGRAALLEGAEGGRPAAAASLRRLSGQTEGLSARIDEAERGISSEITDEARGTKVLTLVVSSVIGLLLAGLILVLSTLRGRRRRGLEERRAAVRGEQRLQALVRHGSDLITVLSPDGTVLYEAGAIESVLGFDAAELEGEKLSHWLHPQDRPVLTALCDIGEGEARARELRLRHRDGGFRTCEARATSLLGDDLWNGIVLNVWDVSERKELEERLRHQAFHDGLTALANRVLFNERLEHALVRAIRGELTITVLIVDLDDFKVINDSLGHPVGDELLREAARRLDQTMRGADTVARLGGDEFGVILDDSPSSADGERAAQRIIDALGEPFQLAGRALSVSASVGIARAAPGEASPAELVRDADLAMYAAKSEEKGTLASYRDDMFIGAEQRLQLKSDLLEAATDLDQFEVVYQPIVELDDGEVAALEALLRWNHPVRGTIAPYEFIPIAEETGTIVAIGRHALRRACLDARGWRDRSGRDLKVTVNVSTRQLRGEALIDHVSEALRESGLPADRLVLEITETQLMRDVEQAIVILRAIRDLGVRLAIDDFGTGYSSLSQLDRLPVDALKVDRELTTSQDDGAAHTHVLSAVAEIGDSLGLNTVAEGIETPAQLLRLQGLNYKYGQGYLFSRPVPAGDVEKLIADGVAVSPIAG
ncbi:MAG TPA: EAL domain-containing protein [Solirubrobacterales bacterium]|nr:EAL domain-containing protein [Solirubrobacterales bacterium]